MTKVKKCARKISAFGGINFVIDLVEKVKLPKLLDQFLGQRVKQSFYSYSDLILSWVYANLCGACRLEDIMAIKDQLEYRPGFKCPSSDRISDVLRRLATEDTAFEGRNSKNNHQFNINLPLNRLLLRCAIKLKEVNKKAKNTLDYDNVLIFNNKFDARLTYKMQKGYAPGVMFIGATPVYIENRNGNSVASAMIDKTVERGLILLQQHNIHIERFRSDSAAFNYNCFKILEQHGIKYYVRAKLSNGQIEQANKENKWRAAAYNHVHFEISSVNYSGIKGNYRFILVRTWINDKIGYKYRGIITNDYEMEDEKVLQFYNHRGSIEREFDRLKNNFNWKRLPFSLLSENTVFMFLGALSSIVYRYSLKQLSKSTRFVKRSWWLKNFRFHFINVSAHWVGNTLYLHTDKDYPP